MRGNDPIHHGFRVGSPAGPAGALASALLLATAVVVGAGGSAQASLIGMSANVEEVAAPASTIPGDYESWNVRIFQEQSDLLLEDAVFLDILDPGAYAGLGAGFLSSGTVSAGLRVDSWLIHVDLPGIDNPGAEASGYVEFDQDILGLAVFPGAFPGYGDPATLIDTDALLGSPTTAYADYSMGIPGYFRGLEHLGTADEYAARDEVTLSADRRRVDFLIRNIHDGTDQVRIVVLSAIPEPTTVVLVLLGLTGLGLRSRAGS